KSPGCCHETNGPEKHQRDTHKSHCAGQNRKRSSQYSHALTDLFPRHAAHLTKRLSEHGHCESYSDEPHRREQHGLRHEIHGDCDSSKRHTHTSHTSKHVVPVHLAEVLDRGRNSLERNTENKKCSGRTNHLGSTSRQATKQARRQKYGRNACHTLSHLIPLYVGESFDRLRHRDQRE